MIVPRGAGDLTAAWLSAALGRSVRGCEVERIGADRGFASEVYRVRLDPGADAVIVKLGAATSEVAFYARLAPACGDGVLRCRHAAEQGDRSVVVLEDLADAELGDDGRGCSLAQAAAVIDRLAELHARWWGRAQLRDVLPAFGGFAEQLARVVARRAAFEARVGDVLSGDARTLLHALGPRHEPALAVLAGPPATLVHRDCHLDNIAFCARGPVIFDWQRACVGAAALDVALFATGALPEAEREAHEPALIDRYHRALVAGGVTGYPRARLDAHLRAALLRCFIGTVNGVAGTPARAARWNRTVAAYGLLDLVR